MGTTTPIAPRATPPKGLAALAEIDETLEQHVAEGKPLAEFGPLLASLSGQVMHEANAKLAAPRTVLVFPDNPSPGASVLEFAGGADAFIIKTMGCSHDPRLDFPASTGILELLQRNIARPKPVARGGFC